MKNLEQYFFCKQSPFSAKKTLNTKAIKIVASIILFCGIVVLLLTGPEPSSTDQSLEVSSKMQQLAVETPASQIKITPMSDPYLPSGYSAANRDGTRTGPKVERQYTSAQFVAPASQHFLNHGGLPMASTISVRLVNSVISTDSVSPVIALTTSDALDNESSTVIPAGTQVVGQASFDDLTRRLQIRFHSVVFEDGKQRGISGIALLDDGSAGLTGEYHSSSVFQQAGRFLSTFIGGMADGMKDKEASASGQVIEKGSVKNGLLNGAADAASDQARQTSQEMERIRPFLEVKKGTEFLLYLEKEFVP